MVGNPECKGCIYRSKGGTDYNTCDYMFVTGRQRGCPAGAECTRYTNSGKKWNQKTDIILKNSRKPKRVLLTPEEKREHRNALKRRAYEKKKAASRLQSENGAQEITYATIL